MRLLALLGGGDLVVRVGLEAQLHLLEPSALGSRGALSLELHVLGSLD